MIPAHPSRPASFTTYSYYFRTTTSSNSTRLVITETLTIQSKLDLSALFSHFFFTVTSTGHHSRSKCSVRSPRHLPSTTITTTFQVQPAIAIVPRITMESNQILPVQYETIVVLFEMPGCECVWWEATINSINIINNPDTKVRAIASVTYKDGKDRSGNFYNPEEGSIHFRHGRSVVLLAKEGTVHQGSHSSWKYPKELNQNDNIPHTNSSVQTSGDRNCNEQEQHTVRPARGVHVGVQRSPMKSERKLTTTKNNNITRRRTRSSHVIVQTDNGTGQKRSQALHSQDEGVSYQTTGSSYNNETAESINTLNILYGTLQKEVGAIQAKLLVMDKQKMTRSLSSQSLEKRMLIKYELRRHMRRSLSELRGERGFQFSPVFRRCPVEFSVQCTLQDFSILCSDLKNKQTGGIHYLPTFSTINSQLYPLTEKHVVFEKFETLLQWIGVSSADEMQEFQQYKVSRKNAHHLQVTGGAHWSLDDTARPLNFFFGLSCSRYIDFTKQDDVLDAIASENKVEFVPTSSVFTSPVKSQCLSVATTEWDCDNGAFQSNFRLSQAPSNINRLTHSSIMDYDAFTLTWRPLSGLRSHDIPSTTTERIVLGTVLVFIPAVVFTGKDICAAICSLLQQ